MKKIKNLRKIIVLILIITITAFILIDIIYKKSIEQFYLVEISIEKNDNNYAKVINVEEFQKALQNENIEIIELANDLDLGYNNIKEKIEISNITNHNEAITHPKLIETGVSKIKIQNKDGLIIYSKNGCKILHTNLVIENCKNIKIENIKMEELWEWDEKTQGEYRRNNWDYITIKNSENICIKNCEFSKCYDAITDIDNSDNITIEYCKVNTIDLNSEFYNMQFEYLEQNTEDFPMYNFLRQEAKLSIEEVKELVSYQYKVYTIGTKQSNNKENTNIVIHDNMYFNVKTRIPRLRNTKAYIYNIYVDSTNIVNLRKKIKYKFEQINEKYRKMVSLDTYGAIATECSYALVKNCIFKGTGTPYTIYNKKEKLGFIAIIPGNISSENLKNKLEQVVGNKNEKEN